MFGQMHEMFSRRNTFIRTDMFCWIGDYCENGQEPPGHAPFWAIWQESDAGPQAGEAELLWAAKLLRSLVVTRFR